MYHVPTEFYGVRYTNELPVSIKLFARFSNITFFSTTRYDIQISNEKYINFQRLRIYKNLYYNCTGSSHLSVQNKLPV